jgi:hypothetical protein
MNNAKTFLSSALKKEAICSSEKSADFKWTIYLILPTALGPGVYSASNINEYQKH